MFYNPLMNVEIGNSYVTLTESEIFRPGTQVHNLPVRLVVNGGLEHHFFTAQFDVQVISAREVT